MKLLKEILEKMLPKKRAPIKVPIKDSYGIQRDIYLHDLMDSLEKNNQTVDADMYDKL